MRIVQKTKGGIDYLATVLREKQSVVTRAVFWRVPHQTSQDELSLKLGRYNRTGFNAETLVSDAPKSELTLDDQELRNLLGFLQENYEPLRTGARKFIAIDETFDEKNVEHVKALFRNPDKQRLLTFVLDNNIFPEDLVLDLQHQQKVKAIREFDRLLSENALENVWQKWFAANSWVLGTEFVRILDERSIDTSNVADYLVQAYDGFLDIVEIKRPSQSIRFWSATRDHDNCIPSSDLVKAITQATQYIFEVEREVNSQKFFERVGEVRTVKPRCVLVFGRSNDWGEDEKRAYRILNSSYHNLNIMTYDHVLARAKRLLGIDEAIDKTPSPPDDDIPF